MTRILAVVVITSACALASAGCDSDMSPTRIDVAGSWTGTWQFVTGGATVTDAVTATLTQNGTNATGTWMAASGPTGELSFEVRDSINGTLTMTQTAITGQPCTATTTLSGAVTQTTLEFTTTTPIASGICQWAANNQFSFRR